MEDFKISKHSTSTSTVRPTVIMEPPVAVNITAASSHQSQRRKKRQELSFADRIQVIMTHTTEANRDSYVREWNEKAESNPRIRLRKRRPRRTGNEETNRLVWQWYCAQKVSGIRVTGPMLQREALSIARRLGINHFFASNGWLDGFRRLHNIGPKNRSQKTYNKQDLSLETPISKAHNLEDQKAVDKSVVINAIHYQHHEEGYRPNGTADEGFKHFANMAPAFQRNILLPISSIPMTCPTMEDDIEQLSILNNAQTAENAASNNQAPINPSPCVIIKNPLLLGSPLNETVLAPIYIDLEQEEIQQQRPSVIVKSTRMHISPP